jgi:PEP-CTERM motif
MKRKRVQLAVTRHLDLDRRLAGYLAAAGAVGVVMATDAEAVPVGSNAVQPFGINSAVSVDFNQDGQTDFQIDHDRVNLNGNLLDYLQIDKNDINGESNPLDFDPGPDATFQATPFMDGATTRNDANNAAYVIAGPQGSYPAALILGTPIGPTSTFDFQESANFQGGGKDIRANRLIDEDATQIDQVLGGQPASGVQVPFNGPNFIGLGGQTRYLGLQMELNNSGAFNYGWIGVRITNEADATGEVVGWAYETLPGVSILAGTVPEPSTITSALLGGAAIAGFVWRRLGRR